MIAGVGGGEDGDAKRRPLRCDMAEDRRAVVSGSIKSIFQVKRARLWGSVDRGGEGVEVLVEGSQSLRSGEYVK
jgi:hypothetical protein